MDLTFFYLGDIVLINPYNIDNTFDPFVLKITSKIGSFAVKIR